MIYSKHTSKCGKYQYLATFIKDGDKKLLGVVGLNPSVVSEEGKNHTVTRLLELAIKEGYGGICVTNLYAYITPHPKNLKETQNPVGDTNDEWIQKMAQDCDKVLCIWGNFANEDRRSKVLSYIKDKAYAIDFTKSGNPRHILHHTSNIQIKKISYDTKKI